MQSQMRCAWVVVMVLGWTGESVRAEDPGAPGPEEPAPTVVEQAGPAVVEAPVATPAPVAEPPVVVLAEPAPFLRGLSLTAEVGLALAMNGPLAEAHAFGATVRASARIPLFANLSGRFEVGATYIPVAEGQLRAEPLSYTTFGVGIGGRVTVLPEYRVHPFGEGLVLLQFVSLGQDTSPAFEGASATLGLAATAGVEVDLFERLSVEGGLRSDFLFTERLLPDSLAVEGNGNTFLLTPFVTGSYYF